MDQILNRLVQVETSVLDLRVRVSAIEAVIPHLATKADISSFELRLMKGILATILVAEAAIFVIAEFIH